MNDIRPILSGLAGGAVAVWLSHKLSRWIPTTLRGKPARLLVAENRTAIRWANAASASGLLSALALYLWGGYARNDWRPFGLGFGFALTAPLIVLPVVAALRKQNIKECLVSFAISQHMPIPVIYGLLLLGIPLLAASIVALV